VFYNRHVFRLRTGIRGADAGGARMNIGIDVYNALNANVPFTYVTTYGATWSLPNSALDARFAKISAQFDF